MTALSTANWQGRIDRALEVLDHSVWGGSDPSRGLHDYQEAIVRHVLGCLRTRPGMIVAERTGRGKSQIAMAILGVLAQGAALAEENPLRVGLLAPNANVLGNWIREGGLLDRAFRPPEDPETADPTYLWRESPADVRFGCGRTNDWIEEGNAPSLYLYADHYGRGITNGFGGWSKDPKKLTAQGELFFGNEPVEPLDLLIIDEAHQLKSSSTNRARAIQALFGGPQSPVPVRRVLLLTATPFQLRAAPELARLIRLLRFPGTSGEADFSPKFVSRTSAASLQRLFDRFERVLSRWLMLKLGKHEADKAFADAEAVKQQVEGLLREVIVRTDFPMKHVKTLYGKPNPEQAADVPDPSRGLNADELTQRLLFLAWDGSIASRTTFVASEQQTLTSSAAALRSRHEHGVALSAIEQSRRPLAPHGVQTALAELASKLAHSVDPDHVKVVETANAVVARLETDPRLRPVLVFAERTATLHSLKATLEERLPGATIEVLDGGTSETTRKDIVMGFNAQDGAAPVHVVLASQVAEMGLDIDGPAQKQDIWLIHHDFPWNPGMVDQRNGRVCRPAKGSEAPVYITYPFIRDSVDERIFKRMLMRQAIAELLLGTDDVARALRLTDQDTLDDLSLKRIKHEELRLLTPDLSPANQPGTGAIPPAPPVTTENTRPGWCPEELAELAIARASTDAPELARKLQTLPDSLAVESWESGACTFVRCDVGGRRQAVAVYPRGGFVEAVSLADTQVDEHRLLAAISSNARPGVAGLHLVENNSGDERLVARATNLLDTLDDSELHRLVAESARRADQWESEYYGGEDRW